MGKRLTGIGAAPGVGVGPARWMVRRVPEPPADELPAGTAEAENSRAERALADTAAELETLAQHREGAAGGVLAAQALMARDPALAEEVGRRIAPGARSAARAVHEACTAYRDMLMEAGGHIAGRATDLDDVRERTVARLLGVAVPGVPASAEPYVLLARELTPADAALLDPGAVAALLTEEGGPTGHTAILARSLGVPAVLACPSAAEIAEGTLLRVDGGAGTVTVDPAAAPSLSAVPAPVPRRGSRRPGPGRTRDGHPVPLLANIGHPREAPRALEKGAEGVGLYRTEFLFLDRTRVPSEAEQVAAYRPVLDMFPGAGVAVRVLDAGADKPLAFLPPQRSAANPALGERGIRRLRHHPEVLAGQLAALARAAADTRARLEVMAPMVADVEETRWFAAAAGEAGLDRIGVMIEVPSAALRARDLAGSVDFFSLGTNDLAQYTCAAERDAVGLDRLQDPWQPALLDLVAVAVSAAAAAGRPIGVCGEAAADPALACVLAGLGATSLSIGVQGLSRVRAALAGNTLARCRAAAEAARRESTGPAARAAAHRELSGLAGPGE